jgi:hypothetical protein
MNDATATVQRYLDIWNQADANARAGSIDQAWADDAAYADPLMNARGRTAIGAMIGAVQQHYPAHRFERHGPVDVHGANLRFSWRLHDAVGKFVAQGTDFAVLDEAQRFSTVTGFLDAVPGATT